MRGYDVSAAENKKGIDLYTWNTPNGRKVSIMLEEVGLPYRVFPIDITKGDQLQPGFLQLSLCWVHLRTRKKWYQRLFAGLKALKICASCFILTKKLIMSKNIKSQSLVLF